jgi:long-chain-fatty-acid--CoA ligase ACSBG
MSKIKETQDFRSTDLDKPVRVCKIPTDRIASVDPISVPALLKRTAENYANHTALMYKDAVRGDWTGITYKEYREKVEHIAKAFIKLGLQKHGVVAVLAFNSVEWFVSELGAIHAG